MKSVASIMVCAMSALAIGNVAVDEVPVGTFQSWLSFKRSSLHFMSGGVDIVVDPLPCPPHASSETTCGWEGYNNQAQVRVKAPGVAPFTVPTDGAAEYVRVAAVTLAAGHPRPSIVIDNDSGGSSGNSWVTVAVPTVYGYRAVSLTRRSGNGTDRNLQGAIPNDPKDLSGDGVVDFTLEDSSFAYTFGCGACTPRPPLILSVVDGKSVDLSASPSVRAVFARDMTRLRPRCFAGGDADRNGACAAYVADAARAGRLATGWRDMLAHHNRHPQKNDLWQACDLPPTRRSGICPDAHSTHYRRFPESLRAFLVATNYITPRQAAALPIPKAG